MTAPATLVSGAGASPWEAALVGGLLARHTGVQVVARCFEVAQVVAATRRVRPDVVLMDLAMPGQGGLEATRRIVALGTGARVLILTGLPQEEQLLDVLEAGARGFVDKAGPVDDLTRAIRTVMQGRRFLGADAARVVVLQRYLRERQVANAPKKRWGTSEGGRGEGAHP